MCLIHLELENLQFYPKIMTSLLFYISLLCTILYPWDSMKYLDYSTLAMELYTAISSPYVKLFLFIFCFVDNIDTDPFTRDIMVILCPQQSSCTMYEASTHQFNTDMSPSLMVSFSSLVPLIYYNTRFIFPQSSSSGFFTHVVRNATSVCMSWHDLALVNSCFTTIWWRVCV